MELQRTKGKGELREGRRCARRDRTRDFSGKLKRDCGNLQFCQNWNHRHAERRRVDRRACRRTERANMRSIAARVRVGTQVELPGQEQEREHKNEEDPRAFTTHVLNKTKLRQERLARQGIRLGLRPIDKLPTPSR